MNDILRLESNTRARLRARRWSARAGVLALVAAGTQSSFAAPEAEAPAAAEVPVAAEPPAGAESPASTSASPQTLGPSAPPAEPPSKQQCLDAHVECQNLQNTGDLVAAREQAKTCTDATCPGMVIGDCARWLADLEQRTPSVVFEVRVNGVPNWDATVLVDGQPTSEWIRGEALRLNPGQHSIDVTLPPHSPRRETLVLAVGMRYRLVSIDFKAERAAQGASTTVEALPAAPRPTPAAPAPAPLVLTERPVPFLVYPLLGVGALGLGGFIGFTLAGQAEQRRAEDVCAPFCSERELRTLRRHYLIGNTSLGIGAAAVVGAGILYLARPERRIEMPVALTIGPNAIAASVDLQRF